MVCCLRVVKVLSELQILFLIDEVAEEIVLLDYWLLSSMGMSVASAEQLFLIQHHRWPLLLIYLKLKKQGLT